jgi:glycosyltransferase involved in cell wall biosynthesis
VIADSRATAIALQELIGARERVHTVRIGGLDLDKFSPSPGKKKSRSIVIGIVARLQQEKGLDLLLKRVSSIASEYPDLELWIVGDGTLRKNLEDLARNLGLEKSVRFLGWRHDVPELLRKLDIYVQPSYWEGLCMTVVEAMASGLPVVASDVGGIAESVVDGETGFLIKPGDGNDLALRISQLINDPELRHTMGQKGLARAREMYGIGSMVQKLESILDNLVKRKLGLVYDQASRRWLEIAE